MYKISISPEEIDKLELVSFPGKIKVIDSVGLEFLSAVRYLKRQKIIGFDTESRPSFSPDQPHYGVSLLQLSGAEKAFLFRIKLMGGIPKPLRAVLSNENIIKVGAAVNDDVRGLEKHHDFPPRGFVDLQKIVWEYGIKDKAVKEGVSAVIDFWATWCGPCRAMGPIFEEVAKETDGVVFAKVDVDENEEFSAACGIRSIPTIALFKDGKMVAKNTGLISATELKNFIKSNLG